MALSQERKGTIAVSLTNFLDSGCIVGSSVVLTAWAAAFGFDATWTAICAIGANAFGAAVGALIGGFLTDKFSAARSSTGTTCSCTRSASPSACAPLEPAHGSRRHRAVRPVRRRGRPGIVELHLRDADQLHAPCAANIGISQFAWSCGPAIIFILNLILSFAATARVCS